MFTVNCIFFLYVVDFGFYCVPHTEMGKSKGLQSPLKVGGRKSQMFLYLVSTTGDEVFQ